MRQPSPDHTKIYFLLLNHVQAFRLVTKHDRTYQRGLHLKSGKPGVKEEWMALNEECFNHSDFKPFKDKCYKKNDYRKIQDKFKATKEAVEQDMSSGNKSKYEGDLSELYRIILQMVQEEEDAKEEKESQKELKRKLDENIDQVLSVDSKKKPMQGFGSRKSLDGSVDSKASTPSNKLSATDDTLYGFLSSLAPRPAISSTMDEEAAEKMMIKWVRDTGKTGTDLMTEARVENVGDIVTLCDEFGLELIINLYCTPGKKFSSDEFKKSLTEEGVSTLTTKKIYLTLQTWRTIACEYKGEFSTPGSV